MFYFYARTTFQILRSSVTTNLLQEGSGDKPHRRRDADGDEGRERKHRSKDESDTGIRDKDRKEKPRNRDEV